MIRTGYAKEEHLERIAAMEAEIFGDGWSLRSLTETLVERYADIIVALEDEKILGYLICYQAISEGNIVRIAVDAKNRRRGIAGRMIDYLKETGREKGMDTFFLEVRESNAGAIAFYESAGFAAEGIRKGFYDRPKEDAVMMWLREDGR